MGKGRQSGQALTCPMDNILTVDCGFSASGPAKSIEYRWKLHQKVCKKCRVKKTSKLVLEEPSYLYSHKGVQTLNGESISSLWKQRLKSAVKIEN